MHISILEIFCLLFVAILIIKHQNSLPSIRLRPRLYIKQVQQNVSAVAVLFLILPKVLQKLINLQLQHNLLPNFIPHCC